MEERSYEFLRRLIETPSPSGFEGPVQKIWKEYTSGFADRVWTDLHGNTIASKNEGGSPRVLFAGHCDELGFMVTYINDEGYLYFKTIGGFDLNIVPGRRVQIHTKNGPVFGVIGRKAVHLMEEEERKKPVELHTLWIDIGAKDKEEARKLVSIGDPVTYTVGLERLQGDLAVGRGFDDRAGAFAVAEALRLLSEDPPEAAVFAVSTVQEEVGRRGAATSTFGLEPKVGIAVDVIHASDHPEVDKRKAGEVKLGGGPVISRGADINPVVADMLVRTAEEEGIPYQMEGSPRDSGTDAHAIQVSRAGVASGVVSIPLRYMHTPVEVLSLTDLENVAKLLAAFARRITRETEFVPW